MKKGWNMRKFVWETLDEIDKHVAENVRKLRKRLGISQKRLSEFRLVIRSFFCIFRNQNYLLR